MLAQSSNYRNQILTHAASLLLRSGGFLFVCLFVCFFGKGEKRTPHTFTSRVTSPPNERISQHLCYQCPIFQAVTTKGTIDEKCVYPLFRQAVNAKLIQ